MNKNKHFGKWGIALCGVLLGSNSAPAQPSASVEISVPVPSVEVTLPAVEIRAESDFYEPLAPEGEWVVVGSYGRCWRPGHVASDWRPYCNGSWQRTDAGWYWVSDEPWAWATYHYGRWDYADRYGWYWVPQIQWAPAWVSWHEGGGYVGWAPLQPSVSISVNGFVGFDERRISPRAFVFVEQRQFLNPISPSIVVVNNTTIINKTKTVTNTRIVNNTVINEGPATTVIEHASGRKVQTVAVQDLRQRQEAPVVARQHTMKAKEIKEPTPARTEVAREKAIVAHDNVAVQKPDAITPERAAPVVKSHEGQVEKHVPAPVAPETRPEIKHEPNHEAPVMGGPAQQNAERQPARHEQAIQPNRRPQQPPREKPAVTEKNGGDQPDKADQDHQPKQ